jgi:hypothetical protein
MRLAGRAGAAPPEAGPSPAAGFSLASAPHERRASRAGPASGATGRIGMRRTGRARRQDLPQHST